MPKIIK